MDKKQLYNKIMEKVAIQVKKVLNEGVEPILGGEHLQHIIENSRNEGSAILMLNKMQIEKLPKRFIDLSKVYKMEYYNTYVVVSNAPAGEIATIMIMIS